MLPISSPNALYFGEKGHMKPKVQFLELFNVIKITNYQFSLKRNTDIEDQGSCCMFLRGPWAKIELQNIWESTAILENWPRYFLKNKFIVRSSAYKKGFRLNNVGGAVQCIHQNHFPIFALSVASIPVSIFQCLQFATLFYKIFNTIFNVIIFQ